jgi:hypothetical protein
MRYVLGFLLAIGLLILVIFLIVRGFSGDEAGPQAELIDYAQTDTVMRMTVEGPVNAEQEHRSATVTIGRSSNEINVIQGYQGQVLNTRTYASNENAYATFLRALDLQGYNRGDVNPENEDSRGYCPTGRVYIFEIITGSATVQKFWDTTCGDGTFDGNTSVVRELFREQIPDYSDIIRGTRLN